MVATQVTQNQKDAVMGIVLAVADVIRALGSVPSGHLYARLMGKISLDDYNAVIGALKTAGVVKEENFLLTWVGPIKVSNN